MEAFALNEISVHRKIGCGAFPFELGWKPSTGPVCVGVRFEITEMRDGLGYPDPAHS